MFPLAGQRAQTELHLLCSEGYGHHLVTLIVHNTVKLNTQTKCPINIQNYSGLVPTWIPGCAVALSAKIYSLPIHNLQPTHT